MNSLLNLPALLQMIALMTFHSSLAKFNLPIAWMLKAEHVLPYGMLCETDQFARHFPMTSALAHRRDTRCHLPVYHVE